MVQQLASGANQIDTDDSTSYVELENFVPRHHSQIIPKEKVGEWLPWVHIAISNAKRQLLNTFHDIKPEFLQNYLDEFCFYTFMKTLFAIIATRHPIYASCIYFCYTNLPISLLHCIIVDMLICWLIAEYWPLTIMSGLQPSNQGIGMDTPPLRDRAEIKRAFSPIG